MRDIVLAKRDDCMRYLSNNARVTNCSNIYILIGDIVGISVCCLIIFNVFASRPSYLLFSKIWFYCKL